MIGSVKPNIFSTAYEKSGVRFFASKCSDKLEELRNKYLTSKEIKKTAKNAVKAQVLPLETSDGLVQFGAEIRHKEKLIITYKDRIEKQLAQTIEEINHLKQEQALLLPKLKQPKQLMKKTASLKKLEETKTDLEGHIKKLEETINQYEEALGTVNVLQSTEKMKRLAGWIGKGANFVLPGSKMAMDCTVKAIATGIEFTQAQKLKKTNNPFAAKISNKAQANFLKTLAMFVMAVAFTALFAVLLTPSAHHTS